MLLGYEVRCKNCAFRSSGKHRYDESRNYVDAQGHERRTGHEVEVIQHHKRGNKPRFECITSRWIWTTHRPTEGES